MNVLVLDFRFGPFIFQIAKSRSGEDDIDNILAELVSKEAARVAVTVEAGVNPSPRMAASLTPHPCADALILFGGEFMGMSFIHS
jgi:hypothetical protein